MPSKQISMSTNLEIKNHIHALVDLSQNHELLEIVRQLLDSKKDYKEGALLSRLTEEQREELYQSYKDSFDESELIDLDHVKLKHKKWLEE